MDIFKFENVFTDKELKIIRDNINVSEIEQVNTKLGRLQYKTPLNFPFDLLNKVNSLVFKTFTNLALRSISAVEYSAKYGKPNLPVHYDHDSSDLVLNFQLESNTSWDIGIDKTVYSLKDNEAILFNPNKYTHWRPHKTFRDDEYIKMIFFRFHNPKEMSDYSHLNLSEDDKAFKEVSEFRDSLGT
jgi:hypothetical protein